MAVIDRIKLYDMFGVDSRYSDHMEIGMQLERVLLEVPRNMVVEKDVFTTGVVARCVAAGLTVQPNWFVQNKATHRLDLKDGRYTVSQSGIVTRCKSDTGIALQAYCIKNGYTQCRPWKITDMYTGGPMLIVAWQLDQDSTDVLVLTTVGNRRTNEQGVQVAHI